MNDRAGQDTTYTYTDVGAVSTITGPGAKVWNAFVPYRFARGTVHALHSFLTPLGTVPPRCQPTDLLLPNGMAEAYDYDSDHRLTKKALLVPAGGAVANPVSDDEAGYDYNGLGQGVSRKMLGAARGE